MALRDSIQEVRELGLGRTLFRLAWEARLRSGAAIWAAPRIPELDLAGAPDWLSALPFTDAAAVVHVMHDRIAPASLARLAALADDAIEGRILCFGRWVAELGRPIDWHLNPIDHTRWDGTQHFSKVLRDVGAQGDVKLAWEAGRFPQAYHLARAAAFHPDRAGVWTATLDAQIASFLRENPYPLGIHWASSQEITIRLAAWLFALSATRGSAHDRAALTDTITGYAWTAGHHLADEIGYARHAVYNNHLIAEALGLYLVSRLVPSCHTARGWAREGLDTLDVEAERQVYRDGAYINLSHNYHRVILQDYLLAWALRRSEGVTEIPGAWRRALERSLDFLVAHQNPTDGRLPNQGANDGSLPRVLSTCDFADYRPTLQCLSVAVRGERIYPPGPWDEEAAWLFGARALDVPLRPLTRRSVSFAVTGYHVLRGADESSFSALRCGDVPDRFGQIEMLHLDVWWRGQNVLVDGGTYLYNGPGPWHDHLLRTESHNTVRVDGRDQMLHYRKFKFLYPTRARLLAFGERGSARWMTGEHLGYARHPGGCVHRRSVLMLGDDVWVVVDRVEGEGRHTARLHWLAGDFPFEYTGATLALATPRGRFTVTTFDARGEPLPGDVVVGQEDPPRGWMSRYYAEKVSLPSLVVTREGDGVIELVTVMGDARAAVSVRDGTWTVAHEDASARFTLDAGRFIVG
jgi:asparagine synthase (glutamine-hydrolysing)